MKLKITSPANGIHVSGSTGVLVSGTACGLTNETVWLFDLDYGSNYYYEDYRDTPGPVTSRDGAWSIDDSPIGNQGDSNTKYTLTLVLASQSCSAALLALQPVDGDYKIVSMPPGCQIIQGVDVYVTY